MQIQPGSAVSSFWCIQRSCDAKLAGRTDTTDVASFVKVVSDIKVKLFQIEEADIVKIEKTLPKTLKPVPGTMKLHQIIWTHLDEETIYLRELSCDTCQFSPNCTHHGIVPNKYAFTIQNIPMEVEANRICCASCEDIFESDTEEEQDLKNVGCDKFRVGFI
ncbi:unnamed protein product [Psylliodes chrysocephalus]|uniref:Uncharacterized protein n=1 Tax=Psylliodes chrysocephalus TaxID=3402493 RepID=A0A9P0CD71_9CUCU|nr:unnamed protein product [Psylliodes chrysocephala]